MQGRNGFPFVFVVPMLFLFPVLAPHLLQSQTIWTNVGRNKSFTVEYLRPNLEGENDLSGLSSAIFLSGQFRINRLTNLIIELPIARIEESGSAFEIDETMVGNPYIGLEIRSRRSSNFVELGIRPPIASESKVFAAARSGNVRKRHAEEPQGRIAAAAVYSGQPLVAQLETVQASDQLIGRKTDLVLAMLTFNAQRGERIFVQKYLHQNRLPRHGAHGKFSHQIGRETVWELEEYLGVMSSG